MNFLRFLLSLLLGPLTSWWRSRQQAAALAGQTRRADAAEAHEQDDEQIIHQNEVRHEVDQSVGSIPAPQPGPNGTVVPAQSVGDAAAGTAAGELRHDGWTRDQ